MEEITNADRARWALEAVSYFVASTGVDTVDDAIADLIDNLLHLGRGHGLDTDALISRAQKMMAAEVAEDLEGDMTAVQNDLARLLDIDGRLRLSGFLDFALNAKITQRASQRPSPIQREPNLQRHLELRHPLAVDKPAGGGDFEPADVADRLAGAGQRGLDRIVGSQMRGADDLGQLVDVVVHRMPPAQA